MKYCQGPKCHEYRTKDRIRGPKGAKHYQTRRRTDFYYMNGNCCSFQCQSDWFDKFGTLALDHFGRTVEPKKTDCDNAWNKMRDWGAENETYYTYNTLTKEERPITAEQYQDNNFTLNQG